MPNTLSQIIIYSKPCSVYALEDMLRIKFKKNMCHKIFIYQPYSLTTLQLAIRPTSHRHMGSVFSDNAGDCYVITSMFFDRHLSSVPQLVLWSLFLWTVLWNLLQLITRCQLSLVTRMFQNPRWILCISTLISLWIHWAELNIPRDYLVTVAKLAI